jgi:hypothetical protein
VPETQFWTLVEALRWIRTSVLGRSDQSRGVVELHEALKSGSVLATGSVDGQPRRSISAAEWYDYDLRKIRFLNSYAPGKAATEFFEVVSKRVYPSKAINLDHRPAQIRVPSSQSPAGEVGYHRVIDDVLLSREEVIRCWSENSSSSPISEVIQKRTRTAPAREAAAAAIKELYPEGIPKFLRDDDLHDSVVRKLKDTRHANISKETVRRAAGRRRK